jgi:RNA polymerase sigma factor (sigma-70 family)
MVPALTGAETGRPDVGRERDAGFKGNLMAAGADGGDADKARRFRNAALPHLDAVYTLASYLLRNAADADDAVQECYLRAFRHFDGVRGQDTKPWLMAILRNVCRSEFARRAGAASAEPTAELADSALPLWQEPDGSPETEMLRELDAETIRGLVAALPAPFREAVVLRDINDLSYREIAQVIDAPVGTVMSRLARARSLLREAWRKQEAAPEYEERSR